MVKSPRSLLEQIEAGALDGQTPLADVLRKCVALGGRAGSADLRDWARRELDGYGDGTAELPAYRIVRAAVRIDGADLAKLVRGQQLSRWEIPEFARETITDEAPIPYGVAELEKLAASTDTLHLQHPAMPDLISYMNSQAPFGTSYQSMYWAVAPTSVHGILDTIRTNLVALVAEMRAVGVDDVPSAEAANQAVNVIINGANRSPVTINTNQGSGTDAGVGQAITSTPSVAGTSKIPAWIRGPWGFAVGAATLVAGITGTAVWLGWNPFG
jgi:AbiTii